MPTYFDRYMAGSYKQVWAELVALGPGVRDEAVLLDAWAVAQETMQRARTNIERIVEHLKTMGYQFQAEQPIQPPDEKQIAEMEAFEQAIGPVPLSVRAWIQMVGEVNLMGSYAGLSYYEPPVTFFQANFMGGPESLDFNQMLALLQGSASSLDPSMLSTLSDLLQSLSGWQQMERLKNPMKPLDPADQVISDPLVVWMGSLSVEGYEEWSQEQDTDDYQIAIAPDHAGKANMSGGVYAIALPNPAADVLLLDEPHHTTFVDYLRIAFQWGGFPGLEGQAPRAADYLKAIRPKLLPL